MIGVLWPWHGRSGVSSRESGKFGLGRAVECVPVRRECELCGI